MADGRPLDLVPAFEALSTLMDAASALAGELRDDPLMGRWMAVFTRMPSADRRTILEVIEREVAMRTASESGVDGVMGFRVTHPNPNARVYSRVTSQETSYVSPDEIRTALLRLANLAYTVLHQENAVHPNWQSIIQQTGDTMAPDELEAIAWCGQMLVSIAERVRSQRAQPGAA